MNEIITQLFQQGPGYIIAGILLFIMFHQQKDVKKSLDRNIEVIRELTMIVSRLEGILSSIGDKFER